MNKRRNAGYTLAELVTVVAIVAILGAAALASYSKYVLRSNRAMGKDVLSQVAARQESFLADRKAYATTLSALGYPANTIYVTRGGDTSGTSSSTAVYSVTLASGASATAFTLTATPINAQTKDTTCNILSLTSTGTRSASGSSGASCWQ